MALHHEIEGDVLLFEYADKDIELVCGSLVTVRQGTLQVIHLTVKEFLTSTHGPNHSTYSDLLVDPAKASLHLTLTCLKCIKNSCNESIVDLDLEIARLDIRLDNEAVIQRQRQAPLAEYACLTWMMHLTDCDGVQMIGVSQAFQETFDSPSTFYWVEACMAFQPDSVLRLLAGLEEAIEHVSGLSSDNWPEGEVSCIFFADWCYALRSVLEGYGSILSHRPWEVHSLDIETSFSSIRQFYKQFGKTSRRDTTVRINRYRSPRPCRPETQAHNRLQQDVQRSNTLNTSIFLIHDERRKLYFWGERNIDLNNARLFVQNAITGQRLPPAVKLDGESGREGSVISYGLSPSGEYIVIVYWTGAKNTGLLDGPGIALIWHINEDMRFKRRMRSEPWAKGVFSHPCKIGLFEPTTTKVAFRDGGYCLTLSGEIHLASGSRRPLLDHLSNGSVSDESTVLGSFYSQNGKYLFISEMTYDGIDSIYRAMRVALSAESSEYLCSWKDSSRRLVEVSPSGRFLVLSAAHDSLPTGIKDEFLVLYDVDTSETVQLPFDEQLDSFAAKYQFVKNEMELIVFFSCQIHGQHAMNVLVWSDLQSHPFLRSHGKLKLIDILAPHQIHVNDDESSALVVLESRVIQRVEFHTQVTFPDAPDVNGGYPCTFSQVSKDGIRWAQLKYGQDRAQLQMTNVSATGGPIHKLDLALTRYDEPQTQEATLSPDLRVLVVDAQVFSIAEGIHGLTSATFTIQGLSELFVCHRTKQDPRHWCHLRCLISPCNSYVLYISQGDPNAREAFPSTIYAFRIDLVSRSSTKLDLHLPKDLTFVSANFHPSQRRMLLSYVSSPKHGAQLLEEVSPLQISLVELESLEMKRIVLPEDRFFMKRVRE